MAHIERSVATLRVIGDDLLPDEISRLFGCPPTKSQVKGEAVRGQKTDREYTKKIGIWRLEATDREPENLDEQVAELLSKLTQDLAVWSKLKERFKIDLFCGLFMDITNEGASLSSDTLLALGVRGIELSLDIYCPIEELKEGDPCPCESGKTYSDCCMPNASHGINA